MTSTKRRKHAHDVKLQLTLEQLIWAHSFRPSLHVSVSAKNSNLRRRKVRFVIFTAARFGFDWLNTRREGKNRTELVGFCRFKSQVLVARVHTNEVFVILECNSKFLKG